jgi:hypothetical protein
MDKPRMDTNSHQWIPVSNDGSSKIAVRKRGMRKMTDMCAARLCLELSDPERRSTGSYPLTPALSPGEREGVAGVHVLNDPLDPKRQRCFPLSPGKRAGVREIEAPETPPGFVCPRGNDVRRKVWLLQRKSSVGLRFESIVSGII